MSYVPTRPLWQQMPLFRHSTDLGRRMYWLPDDYATIDDGTSWRCVWWYVPRVNP